MASMAVSMGLALSFYILFGGLGTCISPVQQLVTKPRSNQKSTPLAQFCFLMRKVKLGNVSSTTIAGACISE